MGHHSIDVERGSIRGNRDGAFSIGMLSYFGAPLNLGRGQDAVGVGVTAWW